MKLLYETTVTNTGAGRAGKVTSDDGHLVMDIIRPPEQMKGVPGTNPEQLFAAGYSSCFNSALRMVLMKGGVKFESTEVAATVSMYQDPEDNGFKLAVTMKASVKGVAAEEVMKYIEMAHKVCPYSKATMGNIEVRLEVV